MFEIWKCTIDRVVNRSFCFWNLWIYELQMGAYLLTYCPQYPLAWSAAMKVLHSCLFWASFQMVPQVWFRVLISPSTVHHQLFFYLPFLHLLCRLQCMIVWVMLPVSFLSMCPIHPHFLLMMMVSMLSWWQQGSSWKCVFTFMQRS